jgi:hypothetical protein
LGIRPLSFLSTFPIVIPFVVIGDAKLAVRASNAVAMRGLPVCSPSRLASCLNADRQSDSLTSLASHIPGGIEALPRTL